MKIKKLIWKLIEPSVKRKRTYYERLWCEGKMSAEEMCEKVANIYRLKPQIWIDMKAWITRDKDGELWLHTHKPKRVSYPGGDEYWELSMNPNASEMQILDEKVFKDLKWEDNPLRVEIKAM